MSIAIEICWSRRSRVYRMQFANADTHTLSLRPRQKGVSGYHADTRFSNDTPDSRGVFNYARWILV